MDNSGPSAETPQRQNREPELKTVAQNSTSAADRRSKAGQTAVWQARLIMLVMINVAQLWILAATVDAALARHYAVLLPLVIASGVCFVITLSIIKWWRPTSRRTTSSGYVRSDR
jgi:uncharacterized protein DUF6755